MSEPKRKKKKKGVLEATLMALLQKSLKTFSDMEVTINKDAQITKTILKY